MKQMQLPASAIEDVDYERDDLPSAVREFKPAVYRDGGMFCCLLGEDPASGIFGEGKSITEAIVKWDRAFQDRVAHPGNGDDLVQYIQDTRSTSKNDVW